MPAFFITATGTEIGKTFVTVGLIRALRKRGSTVRALKPIVSGFDEADYTGSDPALLLQALGQPVTAATLDNISPWRYTAPLSPDMAARKQAERIDLDKVVAYCRHEMAQAEKAIVLVEGIGGAMVPLNEEATVLDLMVRLPVSTILVSGTYLGAISHLLCTLEVLKQRDLLPCAIVLNETMDSAVEIEDMLETLSHFCGAVPLVVVPRQTPDNVLDSSFEVLINALKIA
jgi:dethiobiotin synthetase